MGKRKNAARKDSKAATNADGGLPSFDEKALSALTEKIEKGLEQSKAPQQSRDTSSGKHKQGKESKGRPDSNSRTKPTKSELNRGTKRDAQGNVKGSGQEKAGNANRASKKTDGGAKDGGAMLLQEILALGGTEDDLDLIAGAASDDENLDGNNAPAADKSFQKDLAKFVAGLGIEGAIGGDVSEPEEDPEEDQEDQEDQEDDQAEEDWEEASDLDSTAESEMSAAPKEATKKQTSAPPDVKKSDVASQGPNRLVSILLQDPPV
jgi:ribosome biogenesis protein MAK21